MRSYKFLALLLGIAIVLAACGSGVAVPAGQPDRATLERDAQAFVAAMKPKRPGRPVIAVLARNEATETTDFLLTHAVLHRSGVADVYAVAPKRGRVSLYPVLDVEVAHDLAGFDRAHPDGADYVIVPAMLYEQSQDAAVTAWLAEQARRGARIVGVCAGALVVGSAGLLDGRRFTTHWYFRKPVLERHPGAVYVPHRRYVVDRGVATTTGITASMPAMLALVEAIGGRARAAELADEIGVASWGVQHDSAAFGVTFVRASHYLLDKAAFWRNERRAVDVRDGTDDIALALAADAWSRTGHLVVEAASAAGAVKLRSGLTLVAKPASPQTPRVRLDPTLKPAQQLEQTLNEIEARFGAARREWVAVELEYPGPTGAR